MRRLIVIAISIVVLDARGAVHAAGCPADARKASLTLWAAGSIPTGHTVSGKHPCGRQLTCTGGVQNNFSSRSCHWD